MSDNAFLKLFNSLAARLTGAGVLVGFFFLGGMTKG
jgi:hypothetical protein